MTFFHIHETRRGKNALSYNVNHLQILPQLSYFDESPLEEVMQLHKTHR